MPVSLKLTDVCFSYKGIAQTSVDVIKNINLDLENIECTAIVGQSGSGKTTLIQHFTGLLQQDFGDILFNNENIWHKKYNRTELRRRIGLLFQFPETQLFEETVEKDIGFGPKNLGWSADRITESVHKAMHLVGLQPDRYSKASPFHLSEGEKRRVAIAGVLSMQPEMIVMDEPTAGLDPQNVKRIEKIILNLLQEQRPVVLVTHNMDLVSRICGRVVVMMHGEIVFDGTPRDFFKSRDLVHKAGLLLPDFIQELDKHRHKLPAKAQDVLTFAELKQVLDSSL